ncbi:MAG: M23 family metallopeptidase [Elusimicrobia bacterium]|nr:M23 family metallopeptidase [Elusimicrobiota bacterium]
MTSTPQNQERFYGSWAERIRSDIEASPAAADAPNGNFRWLYTYQNQVIEVTFSKQGRDLRVSSIRSIERPLNPALINPVQLDPVVRWDRQITGQNNQELNADIEQAVQEQIENLYGQQNQNSPASDNLAAILLYNEQTNTTNIYQTIYGPAPNNSSVTRTGQQLYQVRGSPETMQTVRGCRSYQQEGRWRAACEGGTQASSELPSQNPQDYRIEGAAFPPVRPSNSDGEIVLTDGTHVRQRPHNPDQWQMHNGFDIRTNDCPDSHCPVLSLGDGEVVEVGASKQLGYYVIVKYTNKDSQAQTTWLAVTAHMDSQSVNVGDSVETGTSLGLSGTTGGQDLYGVGSPQWLKGVDPHIHFMPFRFPESRQEVLSRAIENNRETIRQHPERRTPSQNVLNFIWSNNNVRNVPVIVVNRQNQVSTHQVKTFNYLNSDISSMMEEIQR